jgi:hypothetical protein
MPPGKVQMTYLMVDGTTCSWSSLCNRQGNPEAKGDGTCRYYNGNIRKALGGAIIYHGKKKKLSRS